MNSLTEIDRVLRLALGNEALFSLVNTRIILRTGLDLRSPPEAEDADAVQKVIQTLESMGYSIPSLVRVAQAHG